MVAIKHPRNVPNVEKTILNEDRSSKARCFPLVCSSMIDAIHNSMNYWERQLTNKHPHTKSGV